MMVTSVVCGLLNQHTYMGVCACVHARVCACMI